MDSREQPNKPSLTPAKETQAKVRPMVEEVVLEVQEGTTNVDPANAGNVNRRMRAKLGEMNGQDGGLLDRRTVKEEVAYLKECILALQKMVLRQEDFSGTIKSELGWVMFLRLDMRASAVPSLYAMQKKWRELKERNPEQLQAPMRVDLVKALFKEFGSRLEGLPQQKEQVASLVKLGWYKEETMEWTYVR